MTLTPLPFPLCRGRITCTAMAAALILAAGCGAPADGASEGDDWQDAFPDELDETATEESASGLVAAPKLEEIGLASTGRFEPAIGGWVGTALVAGQYKRAFAGDNSLLLLGLSHPRYAHGRDARWTDALRDFVLDMEIDKSGKFKEGRVMGPAGNVTTPPAACGPSTDSKVMLGVVAYTAAYRQRTGAHTAVYYRNNIGRILRAQHPRFMRREQPTTGCPAPWNQAQGNAQRDYSKPASLVLHMVNTAEWARVGGAEFRNMAKETWALLKSMRKGNGTFDGGVLPNTKALYAMSRTLDLLGDFDGLQAARNKLRGQFGAGPGPSLTFAGERDTDTQAAGFHVLGSQTRSPGADVVIRNRLCLGGGHSFRGSASAGPSPGPVEDLGLGMAATAKMAASGWADSGACL